MSRNKKKSAYLNPDVDDVIEAVRAEMEKGVNTTSGQGWGGSHGGWVSQGSGSNSATQIHHHYGDELIFSAEGKQIYGGKMGDVELYGSDCFVDLAGAPATAMDPFLKAAPERFKELNKFVKLPEVVRLNWKDYSYPNIGLEFWQSFWKLLPKGKIVVACMGGHGRTGTCSAALMIAAGVTDALSAIDHVRTVYCSRAIETKGQEQYLVDLEKGFYNY